MLMGVHYIGVLLLIIVDSLQLLSSLCIWTAHSPYLLQNKKPHECSLCEFEAVDNVDLQYHMIKHCKSRQYQCKQCEAVFNYKSQLRAHTR